eukprot:11219527-Lingulodinium_polyedra.AAC.1
MVLAALGRGSTETVLDSMPVSDIMRYAPDEGQHLLCLHDLTGKEVRRFFGMNAFLVACWACLMGGLDDPSLHALMAASDSDLWDAAANEEDQDDAERPGRSLADGFSLTPRAVAARVQRAVKCGSKRSAAS